MSVSIPVLYPLINGVRYGYSAISFVANGLPIVGVNSIDYEQTLEAGEAMGTLPQVMGTTRGILKCTTSFTMLQLEYYNLIQALSVLNGTPGSGHMEVRWDIQVIYQDGVGPFQGPLIADIIRGFKIEKAGRAFKADNEALMIKVEGKPYYILENGQAPIGLGNMALG